MRVASCPTRTLLLAAVVAAAACGEAPDPERGVVGGAADSFADLPLDEGLLVPLPEEPFDFHPDRQGLELDDARWLAWLSANEYAHFGYLGPALERLGFGRPGEGEAWREAVLELYRIRDETGRRYGEARREGFEAAAFEHGLIQTTDAAFVLDRIGPEADGSRRTRIQFFSGGRYVLSAEANEAGAYPSCSLDPLDYAPGVGFDEVTGRAAEDEAQPGSPPAGGAFCDLDGDGDYGAFDAYYTEGSTQCLWAEHRELPLLVIAFRGTQAGLAPNQRVDVLTDLNLFEVPWPEGGEVHGGFAAALDLVAEELVMPKLRRQVEGTDTAIVVTGHSLGAALATLLTARILAEMEEGRGRYELRGLYTFGSPRVGDREFARRFEELAAAHGVTVARFRHGDDVVTQIPFDVIPWGGFLDFHHVGQLVFLRTRVAEELWYRPDQTWGITGFFGNVRDHDMGRYYSRIVGHLADERLVAEIAAWEHCSNGLDDDDDGLTDGEDESCR